MQKVLRDHAEADEVMKKVSELELGTKRTHSSGDSIVGNGGRGG
jgi:hypothetical protein